MNGEGRQSRNIEAVVTEHVQQRMGIARSKPVEVAQGDFTPWQIVFTEKSQQVLFESNEAAVGDPMTEEPAGGMKKVQMGQTRQWVLQAVQDISGRQEVHIKGLAVESDQVALRCGNIRQGGENGLFFGKTPGAELTKDESPLFAKPAYADEKGQRPRASGQTRRFRIEEEGVQSIKI